ncbi:carbohydrate-binding module family 13 protein [Rhizophagus clarus]|uniref:Carbohydrate-binding module family 13 protein n=1 Tax=Rhizophagus clarus TaxID=94130 RepID=A0A8H3LDG8_9GLOM|nr:carbohydrate-binding module family 13 protein [Rhizophagus clarus]
MADNKFLSKLTQNLFEILNDDEYYDIIIEVGSDPHKKDGTLTHIKLPNILPETFQIILMYIYSGKLFLKDYDILEIIKILVAANELNLQELIPYLQLFLIRNKTKWIEQNFNLIYQTSFKNDSFLELRKFCTELISGQPEKVFNSPDFTSIPEKALISLIQNKNLQMSKVQVWEHVLKWGIAQNPELSSDPSNYSNNDFNALKNTLRQCIPFIKFTEFTSKEFLNKVYPYKKIIPEDLHENLIKYFLDHDYEPKKESVPHLTKNEVKLKSIDSKIITIQHAELISKWVDKLEITNKLENSYEFKLILRGRRDEYIGQQFHKICDNQSRTVTVFKVIGSDEILGGYNPIEWKRNSEIPESYDTTKDSFIFSFKNDDVKNHILSRVKDEEYAINNRWCGPSFGRSDLIIFRLSAMGRLIDGVNSIISSISRLSQSRGINLSPSRDTNHSQSRAFGLYCKANSYEKPIRETENYSDIEEYEIFKIIKVI